jgi:hypothetical protein
MSIVQYPYIPVIDIQRYGKDDNKGSPKAHHPMRRCDFKRVIESRPFSFDAVSFGKLSKNVCGLRGGKNDALPARDPPDLIATRRQLPN